MSDNPQKTCNCDWFDPAAKVQKSLATPTYCWCTGECENGSKPCPAFESEERFRAMAYNEQLADVIATHMLFAHSAMKGTGDE